MRALSPSVILLFILWFIFPCAAAFPQNVTIDDTFGDQVTGLVPVYLPQTGAWNNASCVGCKVNPDPDLAFDGSWTAATYHPELGSVSIELQFTGTAIYVFFITANNAGPGVTTLTQCNFTLDGQLVGFYEHIPDNTTDFGYNALAYSNTSIPNTKHTLIIETSGQDSLFVQFDYAEYTVGDTLVSNPSSSSSGTSLSTATPTSQPENKKAVPVGAIAGGVIGGLALLSGFLALLFYLRRRRYTRIKVGNGSLDGLDGPDRMVELITPQEGSVVSRASHGFDSQTPALASDAHVVEPRYPDHSGHTPHSSYAFDPRSPDSSDNTTSIDDNPYSPQLSDRKMRQVEARRRTRQAQLGRQMGEIRQEMRELQYGTPGPASSYAPSSSGASQSQDNQDVSDLREQIRMMQEQIDLLQGQQTSEWAQGLTDEPPPGYSPAAPSLTRNSTRRRPSFS